MCISFVILATFEDQLSEKIKSYAKKRASEQQAAGKETDESKESEGTEMFIFLAGTSVVLVYFFQISVGFFAATAMLYWHGDYMKFHSAFFDQFSAPSFTFPTVSMI